jgi:hypothetical protein
MRTVRASHLLSILALLALGANPLAADPPDNRDSFTGTYVASLPDRAEIVQLHRDGTVEQTLSDQVTAGAGGFTFSDSLGSWKVAGPRTLSVRLINLNFDLTGPAPAFSGIAVVDFTFEFAPGFRTFTASCQGKIYPPGQDPFAPTVPPSVEFDCSYLNGFHYQRVPLE